MSDQTPDRPRTIAQAATELGIGYHKLRKLVAGHAVPCVRVGRTVRFYDQEIADIKAIFRDAPAAPKPATVVPIRRRRAAA